ncbi:MAG: hypothetical protein AB8E15_09400 [Bdellovibrionales bacterium]
MRVCYIIFLFFSISLSSAITETDDVTLAASSSKKDRYLAEKEIQEKLILQIGTTYVKRIVGPEEFNRKKNNFEKLIRRQYGKFIPFVKPRSMKATNSGYMGEILFKISPASLREVLATEGLLYESTKAISVLPVISFLDTFAAKDYRWWTVQEGREDAFLSKLKFQFQNSLQTELWSEGAYLIDPTKFELGKFLPKDLKISSFRRADLQRLGKRYSADIILYGKMKVSMSQESSEQSDVVLETKAYLSSDMKIVAETSHQWITPAGPYKAVVSSQMKNYLDESIVNLKDQILDSWKKGKFGTTEILLSLKGDLSFDEFQNLKRQIKASNYQIKNLSDRRIGNGSFTLLLEIAGPTKNLSKELEALKLNGVKMKSMSSGSDELVFNVSRN